MNRSEILRKGLILLFFSALFVPLAGAVTQTTGKSGSHDQDKAEIISPLKMHIAYIGKTQQARMDGVITYIDSISGGTGTPACNRYRKIT